MVVPRWLRERRRAELLAVRSRLLALPVPATAEHIRPERGIEPVELALLRDREPMPDEEWEPFIAAIREAKGW